jgi:membrane-associated phospholipid phosphatase
MQPGIPDGLALWAFISRFGEAQIVLPLALVAMLARVRSPDTRSAALRWLAWLALAILVTTATKVAFIGWGLGSARLDFTGISGHTMFATAIYPVLLSRILGRRRGVDFGGALGCALAFLIGWSRLELGVHSVSEVLAGWLIGGAVCVGVLARGVPLASRVGAMLPVVTALWLSLMPVTAPASNTHSMVTRLALTLSGHAQPYTREALRGVQRGAR